MGDEWTWIGHGKEAIMSITDDDDDGDDGLNQVHRYACQATDPYLAYLS